MQRLCLWVLALAALIAAEETKAATKKRGLPNFLGYGNSIQDHSHPWNGLGTIPSFSLTSPYRGDQYLPPSSHPAVPLSLNHEPAIVLQNYDFAPELTSPPIGPSTIAGATYGIPLVVSGGVPKQNGYSTGFGLGAYGSSAKYGGPKYTDTLTSVIQDVTFKYPSINTQIISSNVGITTGPAIDTEGPKVTVPVSGYRPAYPPFMQVPVGPRISVPTPILPRPAQPFRQKVSPAVTLGSGSLGVVRLSNGNFALGSGSIGYGGGPPIVGPQPPTSHQGPPSFFSAQPPASNFGGSYFKGY